MVGVSEEVVSMERTRVGEEGKRFGEMVVLKAQDGGDVNEW